MVNIVLVLQVKKLRYCEENLPKIMKLIVSRAYFQRWAFLAPSTS